MYNNWRFHDAIVDRFHWIGISLLGIAYMEGIANSWTVFLRGNVELSVSISMISIFLYSGMIKR